MFVGFLLPLWLTRGVYLINWDSVQYALGVDAFDLARHQPHPPGYIGYEVLGGLVAHLTGDVPAALTLISVLSGALAPALLFLLARRMMPTPFAVATSLLFGFSPLLWHYGGVALTYAPEVALSLSFVLLAHRAATEGRPRDLVAAAIAFAVMGSVRQSAMIMLAPLWPVALRPYTPRTRVRATALLVAACMAWAIPLLRASGGPGNYLSLAAELADLAVARTAITTASVTGVLQNVGILFIGLFAGMHVTPFVIHAASRRPGGSLGVLSRHDRRFLLAWAIVPLIFFVLIHIGQPGYALLLLPAAYLWVGSALAQVVRHRARGRAGGVEQADTGGGGAHRLWPATCALCAAGVAAFFVVPEIAYRTVSSELGAAMQEDVRMPSPADRTGERVAAVPGQSPLAAALRQYSAQRNDAYWSRMIGFIDEYSGDDSAVLTAIGGPIVSGSFRELGYYLPEHHVYGVGWDRSDAFGYLFRTRYRESNYSVQGLQRAAPTLTLPEGVRLLIVPDADVAGLLDPDSFLTERWDLGGGASVTLVSIPAGSVLEFTSEGDRAEIRLRQPATSP
jgi:hypothetical protein